MRVYRAPEEVWPEYMLGVFLGDASHEIPAKLLILNILCSFVHGLHGLEPSVEGGWHRVGLSMQVAPD